MKRMMLLSGLLAVAGIAGAKTLFSNDFTVDEGFSDGRNINHTARWQAQSGFEAVNTTGEGSVQISEDSKLAKNETFFALSAGDFVVLTVDVTFDELAGTGNPVFGVGLSDATSSSGEHVLSLPALLTLFPKGIGFGSEENRKSLGELDDVKGDTLRLTATFKKSAVPGEFTVMTGLYDVTQGKVLGSASWTEVDQATWNAESLCIAFRGMNLDEVGGHFNIQFFKGEIFFHSRFG